MIIYNQYTPAALEIAEQGYPDFDKNPDYHQKWWTEQIKRCIEGYYASKDDYICGDFYFHLNFMRGEVFDIKRGDKTIQQFPYNDCDHELSDFLWKCEQDHVGAIVMKGRRARFSTIMSSKLLARWTFFPGTSLGVGTYKEEHQQKIRSMVEVARSFMPPELKYNAVSTEQLLEAKKKVKTIVGYSSEGVYSKIYYRTFGGRILNSGAFRSLSTKILLFDEIGENPGLRACRDASEECWKVGNFQYGLPVFGGTSNAMNNADPFLKEFVYNPEAFNCRVHFIPRQRFYEDDKGTAFYIIKTGVATPALQEKARLYIKKEADKRYALENKTSYYHYLQENPTTLEECFMGNSASLMLPMDKVNAQIASINKAESLGHPAARRYNITWKGGAYNPQRPEVEWHPHPEGEYWVAPQGMPDPRYKGLDIGGIDTYYASGAPNSESVGVMYIFRRMNIYDSKQVSHAPIVEYVARYDTNEQFYDGCLKLAVAYSFPNAPFKMLSEFDSTFLMFMEHSKALRYFKEKPSCIDGAFSNTINRYMVKMTGQAKVKGTALLQDYCQEFIENIPFMRLLEDMKYFGVRNVDKCMAFMIALIHNEDEQINPVQKRDSEEAIKDFFPSFKKENGIIVAKYYKPENYSTNIDFLKPLA